MEEEKHIKTEQMIEAEQEQHLRDLEELKKRLEQLHRTEVKQEELLNKEEEILKKKSDLLGHKNLKMKKQEVTFGIKYFALPLLTAGLEMSTSMFRST